MTEIPIKRRISLGGMQDRALPQSYSVQREDDIDVGAMISTLWRGKWWITTVTILAIFLGGIYAYVLAVPMYRSTAVVILDTKLPQFSDSESVVGGLTGDSNEVNSEVEVLRSRSLMGKVVDKLELVDDPDFNGLLREKSAIDQAKAAIKSQIKSLLGLSTKAVFVSAEDQAKNTRNAVVTSLLKLVEIRNIRQSYVFTVTAETQSPSKSALIADTIVQQYVLDQIDVKFQTTEQATAWLSERVTELRFELEQAEKAAAEFSTSTELVSPEALVALERQVKEQRERIISAEDLKTSHFEKLQALEKASSREQQAAIANDVQLDQLIQRISEGFGDEVAFDNRLSRVKSRIQIELARSEKQIDALKSSEQELSESIDQQGQDLIQLQQLKREAEATRLLYEHFLARLKETSAQQGVQQADSRILSDAVVPNSPSSPRKSIILALSGVLGILIGSGLILLNEFLNSSFRTAKELETHTGFTVMGQIPTIPGNKRTKVLNYLTDKPTSAAAESVRNLRTSLLLSNVDNPPQVIISTSSIPGEGKTTIALALAHNALGLGKSVLLVEGDIRRYTLSEYFERVPEKGIVSVISGDLAFDDAAFSPDNFGGRIIGGENTAVNAADLFSSEKFRNFIAEMRQQFEMIIIDTPPVLVVPDARIVAEIADAVLFTVKWDSTSKHQVDEALRLFHQANQQVSGIVLSQISPKGMKRYGYGGKYGAYGTYGSKYYTS